MSVTVALIAEGVDDARVVQTLVGRMSGEQADGAAPAWTGCTPGAEFTTWAGLKHHELPRRLSNRKKDFGAGPPASEDGFAARKALLLLSLGPVRRPAAVILQRDYDNRKETDPQHDLEAARDSGPWPFPVVVGVAYQTIEGWVLAGYTPDAREQKEFGTVSRHLGFDPCSDGHRLSRRHGDESKRAKTIRERLTGGDVARELAELRQAEWKALEHNGRASGLADFVRQVRVKLLPLFFPPTAG